MSHLVHSSIELVALSEELCGHGQPRLSCMDWLRDTLPSVLNAAEIQASEIDLIISMSTSLTHLTEESELHSPRLGYPVQAELEALNAFVIDLQDSGWPQAVEVANGYLSGTDMKTVLIFEANSHDVSAFPALEAGARAAVFRRSEQPSLLPFIHRELSKCSPNEMFFLQDHTFILREQMPATGRVISDVIDTALEILSDPGFQGLPVYFDTPHYLHHPLHDALKVIAPDIQVQSWQACQSSHQPWVWLAVEPFRARLSARCLQGAVK